MTSDNDWSAFSGTHAPGDTVEVSVTKALPFGSLVETRDGIPGLLTQAGLTVGDRITARIEQIDDAQRRLSLATA